MAEKNYWHSFAKEEVVKQLKSNFEKGLLAEEVKTLQREFGKNLLPEGKSLPKLKLLLGQFKSPLIYILVIAGIATLALKEYADSIVIFGAVALNTVVGFFQENKASESLRELRKIVKIEAKVIREGNPKIVDSLDLVPGDIFLLEPGDKVPADGRIIECHNLKVNEMALTGEWLAAEKNPEALKKETPLADRDNMVYMGTVVEDGKARVIVTGTGILTEMGKVAAILKETEEEKTPLQKKISSLSKAIGGVVFIICIFIFIEGIITGNTALEMFITSVAVAVAAIPEGLPVAMTVILALGMQRILNKKGLVRKLLAAETLGSTSVIATDKTCTLTEGKMRVGQILTAHQMFSSGDEQAGKGDMARMLALKIATLCSRAFIENPEEVMGKWKIQGQPTDKALLLAGTEAGINKKELEKQFPKISEIPFSPVYKYIAGLHQLNKSGQVLYICGAPEKLLGLSTHLELDKTKEKISNKKRKIALDKLNDLTAKGYRVIAAAYKKIPNSKLEIEHDDIKGLTFVGFIALKDPLRKGVKKAIKLCRQAGMRPILVTGDHKLTARAIAKEIGFKTEEENILEGSELDDLSGEEFDKRLDKIEIYTRVEPKHKMRIIQAWQDRGEVVAMTGDGINDAPALKKADIGIAIGSGTDVAKETSDLILLPDSFDIIVAAIEEGRAIIDNIRKVITYLLTDSFSEAVLIGGALLFGFPLPILPAQILWINLIEDGLPDIALAFESKEKDLMKRKPEGKRMPLLTSEMKAIIFIIGLITDLLLLGLFFWLFRQGYDISYIRTMVFAGLTIDSLFFVFSCKSLRRNLWQINPFSNKLLVAAVGIGILALLLAVYTPALQALLRTVSLNFQDWLIVFSLGIIEVFLIEITKWLFIIKSQNSKNQI